ncbi:hypothetical protein BKA70DRAFT_1275878 [Coprinopsis sp. MPI-PUGE-AT-0042]|nr:hypothetical protein BKA70DRAFT_1275878 [Coprinopsis sp. MPI-PUGE-AT-0042]
MNDRAEPYDPYLPRAGAAIQAQIDDTVAERGERLDSLQDKTGALITSAVSAQGFRRGANRVRKDMKMRIIIGVAIAVIIVIIVVSIVKTVGKKD